MGTIVVSKRTGLAAALILALATSQLAGCGLAETSATAVTEAKAAADEAKQGKELEEKVQRDIAAAQKTEADARAKMDEASQ